MKETIRGRGILASRPGRFVAVYILCIAILLLLPTGFEKKLYKHGVHTIAKAMEVDDAQVIRVGMIATGEERVKVKLLSGSHKGEVIESMNFLDGQMETDYHVKTGDTLLLLNEYDDAGRLVFSSVVDRYRLSALLGLVLLFAALLVIISGFTGLKTILGFAFTLLFIWKVMIPGFLRGYSPLVVALFAGNLMAAGTILLVSGFSPRSYGAILSLLGCSLITLFVARIFICLLALDGSTMPWIEGLYYAGYGQLDLGAILQGAVYLGCSGAIMDLSLDISATLEEVKKASPSISSKELFRSGLHVGRTVVGAETTLLLLAYMGTSLTILMVIMAQGTALVSVLTSKAMATEILYTFAGCIGLIFVPPVTALSTIWLMEKRRSLFLYHVVQGLLHLIFRNLGT